MSERIWFGGVRHSYAVFWGVGFVAYWLIAWLFVRHFTRH